MNDHRNHLVNAQTSSNIPFQNELNADEIAIGLAVFKRKLLKHVQSSRMSRHLSEGRVNENNQAVEPPLEADRKNIRQWQPILSSMTRCAYSSITGFPLTLIEHIQFQNLKCLDFTHTKLKNLESLTFINLSNLRSLSFHMDQQETSAVRLRYISPLKKCNLKKLKMLSLSRTGNVADYEQLSRIFQNNKLEFLHIFEDFEYKKKQLLMANNIVNLVKVRSELKAMYLPDKNYENSIRQLRVEESIVDKNPLMKVYFDNEDEDDEDDEQEL